MDRELLFEEISGVFSCDDCLCSSCVRRKDIDDPCFGQCFMGVPDCNFTCEYYLDDPERLPFE